MSTASPVQQQASADAPPAEIKQLYRSVYALVKQLDDQRRDAATVDDLYAAKARAARRQLCQHADELMFQPHILVARKAREILWHKAYYELIAQTKRHWAKQRGADVDGARDFVRLLIDEGIATYKSIVVRMNRYFKLDLHYLIDMAAMRADGEGEENGDGDVDIEEHEPFGLELISYGLDTVHAALLSLGDLHRYRIDLQLGVANGDKRSDRLVAARFYLDGFKLNTKVGMAQNQLGTLFAGETYDLHAVYHYLYAMVCAQPFAVSEANVQRLFASNASELRKLDVGNDGGSGIVVTTSMATFMVRFKRLAQICFYDRPNGFGELQALGHQTLCDLRTLLQAGSGGGASTELTADGMFKVVAVLLFAVLRLQAAESNTVHTLNALLVAICAELVDAANAAIERLLDGRREQLESFAEQYAVLYELFDRSVRMNRKMMKEVGESDGPEVGGERNYGGGHLAPAKTIVLQSAANGVHSKASGSSSSQSAGHSLSGEPPVLSNSKPVSSTTTTTTTTASTMALASDSADSSKPAKRKAAKIRCRRRRRFTSDDESDDDEDDRHGGGNAYSDSDDDDYDNDDSDGSDYEMDSDFSSDESSDEEKRPNGIEVQPRAELAGQQPQQQSQKSDSDMSIEGEHFVYPNGTDAEPHSPLETMLLQLLDVKLDAGKMAVECQTNGTADVQPPNEQRPSTIVHEELRYKRRYAKPDPNIVVEFAQHDCTLRALKVLFDWLQANPQLLTSCHATNPEFVHKIMKLINHLNMDVFTRKVFFDRTLLRTGDLRADFERLFVERAAMPLTEDVLLKDFGLLREQQQQLDFELPMLERITANEEHLLRVCKLVDFGFFVSKSRTFGYRFCGSARKFVPLVVQPMSNGTDGGNGGRTRRGRRGGGGVDANERQPGQRRRRNRGTNQRRLARRGNDGDMRRRPIGVDSHTSNDENELGALIKNESKTRNPRKGYLKNRNQNGAITNGTLTNGKSNGEAVSEVDTEFPALAATLNKSEIMGKLWLRNEVRTLESEVSRKPVLHVTPFLVMDADALTDYPGIVKSLLKSKKFVVLIPSAVLSELDSMKKSSEGARNAIRWLETEINKGSRYLRMQRSYESQTIALVKTPRKLDRNDFNFLQIAQFCNYMQASHADDGGGGILTLLVGSDLSQRRSTASPPISYTGIVNAIAVHAETITAFHAKLKNK